MPNYNSAMTGYMATYNAADTTVMVNDTQLFGFAADSIFSVTHDNDNTTIATDPMGTSVPSISNKDSSTVTINLNQTSPSNNVLTDYANRHVEFNLDIKTSTTHYSCPYCLITKIPDSAGGTTAGDRAWQIHCLNLTEDSIIQNNA